MGEIKSTMDLVMERTRHLSMSPEEKVQQQREEFSKRLQGLLQQYADGAFTAGQICDRIGDLQAHSGVDDPLLSVRAVFDRIDPQRENKRWLDVLSRLAPATRNPLEETLAAHRKQQAEILQSAARDGLERLRRRHGITGSAVVPNPLKDARCQEHLAVLQSGTRIRMDAVIEAID
jgi:hypothetical protein